MSMAGVITIVGLIAIASAIAASIIATMRRRRVDRWVTAAFLFPPSLIVLMLLPTNVRPYDPAGEELATMADQLIDD